MPNQALEDLLVLSGVAQRCQEEALCALHQGRDSTPYVKRWIFAMEIFADAERRHFDGVLVAFNEEVQTLDVPALDGDRMSTKDQLVKDLQNLAVTEKAKLGKEAAVARIKDDPNTTSPDRRLIAIDQEQEVRYWMQVLGCTEQDLYEAVASVGNLAEDVRQHLGLLPPADPRGSTST